MGAVTFGHGQKLLWVGAGITLLGLFVIMTRPLMTRGSWTWWRSSPAWTNLPRACTRCTTTPTSCSRSSRWWRPCALGIASWFCECVAYQLTIQAMGFSITLAEATFIYAFATFFGAVTFLPGGLGATEGSMTGLAIMQGVPKDAASAATIVVRIATLWFAVALGLLWLGPNQDALIPDKSDMETEA